jgi:NADP-dependent 3-hydroxy acid dehydrogenase YdfG
VNGTALVIGASGGSGVAPAEVRERRGTQIVRLSRKANGLDLRDSDSIKSILRLLEGTFDVVLVATGILARPGRGPEKPLAALGARALAK